MEPNETRREQFMTELIFAGRREGVVQKEGIADGAVDDAVENVRQNFSLGICQLARWGAWGINVLTTRFPLLLRESRAKFERYAWSYSFSTSRR